jgi:hypothetical protein
VVIDDNFRCFLNINNGQVRDINLDVLIQFFFVVFGDGRLGLACFASRLSSFCFGLRYGSDNEPRFWADFKPLSSRLT